jgi:hypothetical protein
MNKFITIVEFAAFYTRKHPFRIAALAVVVLWSLTHA